MNWDRVRNEDKYGRGGTQRVGGKKTPNMNLPKKRRAIKSGHCKVCKEAIEVNQKIVQGSGRPAVHAGCFRW